MAFVVKVLFLSAIVYSSRASVIHGIDDSYVSSAQSAPSANYGPPSNTYGPPSNTYGPADITEAHINDPDPAVLSENVVEHPVADLHDAALEGDIGGGHGLEGNSDFGAEGHGAFVGGSGFDAGGQFAGGSGAYGQSISGQASIDDGLAYGNGAAAAGIGAGFAGNAGLGAPRVIGTSVSVGRPVDSASKYELQSVVQNIVRRVPIEVTKHVKVAVPVAVPVPVPHEVKVPVPQPYPVHVPVVQHVPYPVYKTEHVEVERPVPYEVIRKVPFEVIRKVPVPVERPYEVIKKVHVPIEKHVEVPVPVWKPYPLHIIKHVTHYKKKSCCW